MNELPAGAEDRALLQFESLAMLTDKQFGALFELGVGNRTLQEVCGPRVKRGNTAFSVLSGGNDNGRNIVAIGPAADLADEIGTRHFGHAIIDDQQVGSLFL